MAAARGSTIRFSPPRERRKEWSEDGHGFSKAAEERKRTAKDNEKEIGVCEFGGDESKVFVVARVGLKLTGKKNNSVRDRQALG